MKKEWGAGRKGAIDFLELGDPLVPFQTIGDLKEGHGGSNLRSSACWGCIHWGRTRRLHRERSCRRTFLRRGEEKDER